MSCCSTVMLLRQLARHLRTNSKPCQEHRYKTLLLISISKHTHVDCWATALTAVSLANWVSNALQVLLILLYVSCVQLPAPLPQLPSSAAGKTLAEFDPWKWHHQRITLPEITLAGPVALVLSHTAAISLFLPHSADAGQVRRILVAPGATITLRHLRSVSLRRPVELPTLPASYLTEVYAHMKLGEPEPGFENSPGIMFLASELYRAATNSSIDPKSKIKQLLSFELQPAGKAATLQLQIVILMPCGQVYWFHICNLKFQTHWFEQGLPMYTNEPCCLHHV